MIPSTQESLGDVYMNISYTKSMVWSDVFPTPEGQPVKQLKHQIHGARQEKLQHPKQERESEYLQIEEFPEG